MDSELKRRLLHIAGEEQKSENGRGLSDVVPPRIEKAVERALELSRKIGKRTLSSEMLVLIVMSCESAGPGKKPAAYKKPVES